MSAGNRKHPYRVYPAPPAKQRESMMGFLLVLLMVAFAGLILGYVVSNG